MSSDSGPLRCHLLIGPPASGKTTLAGVLAQRTGATVLNTDALRTELFGDASIQGPWAEIEQLLHRRLREAVAAGTPVILDATHCQRPWRLAITQALELPAPVQWIGWWLATPLEQCLQWNHQRERQVAEDVIKRMHSNLPSAFYEPASSFLKKLDQSLAGDPDIKEKREQKLAAQAKTFLDRQRSTFREEGFAYVAAIRPESVSDLGRHCESILAEIDSMIVNAANRKKGFALHRYSRLLDLERLIFVIRLLLEFPGVEFYADTVDPPRELPDVQALRRSFRYAKEDPLPSADALFAERVAFALHHRHGPCYADVDAIAEDLTWLEAEGFTSALPITTAIDPRTPTSQAMDVRALGAGLPAAADPRVFQRQFGLLRHLIQNPFDHPCEQPDPLEARHAKPEKTGRKPPHPLSTTSSLRQYLLERLAAIDGVSYLRKREGSSDKTDAGRIPEIRTLDKDIETLIGEYGFRDLLLPHFNSSDHDNS